MNVVFSGSVQCAHNKRVEAERSVSGQERGHEH